MTAKSKIDVKALTVCALLAAMGVVCKALVTFNIQVLGITMMRLGIHLLFVYIAAIMYGPLMGGITGAITDMLGTLFGPPIGAYNPAFSLTIFIAGLVIGYVYKYLEASRIKNLFLKIFIAVFIAQTIIILPLNTLWNKLFYGVPFWASLASRSISLIFYVIAYPIILSLMLPVMQKVLKIKKAAA